jgi:hypothetical protein
VITQDGGYATLKASAEAFVQTPNVPQTRARATSSYAESYIQFQDYLTIRSVNPLTIPNGTPAQMALSAFVDGNLLSFGTSPQETGNNDYAQANLSTGFIVNCSSCFVFPGTMSISATAVGGGTTINQFVGTGLIADVGDTFELTGYLNVNAFANTGTLSASSVLSGSDSAAFFEDTASFIVQSDTPGVYFTSESGATYSGPATPIPATLPLFATGLGGLGLFGWRKKRKAQAA